MSYVQTNTDNESFIKMFHYLSDIGIKNNKFHLRVFDRDLLYVDSIRNPSINIKSKIINEVKDNFWYFAREIVKIPVAGGWTKFELHRGNLAEIYCLLANLNTFLILPRQNFKTISACVVYLWIFLYGTINSEISFSNKRTEDSKKNLGRLNEIRELLPEYLKMGYKDDTENKTFIINSTTKNKIMSQSAAISEEQANNIGRGSTQPCQWYDEFAFLKYNDIIYGTAAPAVSQASREAEKRGKPHHKLITTTPGDLRTPYGIYAKEIIDNAARFDEKIYDWTKEEINDYLYKNSKNDFVFIEFSYKELGRDEKWFEVECRNVNWDQELIKREILLEWSKSTDLSPFMREDIDRMYEHVKEPIRTIVVEGHQFLLYKDFDFQKKVFISVDVATGVEQERSAITITDCLTLEVLGDFACAKTDTAQLSKLLITLGSEVFPNCIIIVENNSIGKAVNDIISKTRIRDKVYYEIKEKKGQFKRDEVGKPKAPPTKMQVYGVTTSSETRDQMIGLIQPILTEEYHKINSRRIMDDIAGLERKKTGRIEHSSVSYDDNIFSYLFTRWVWAYGKNLGRFGLLKMTKEAIRPENEDTVLEGERLLKKMSFIGRMNKKDNNKMFSVSNQIQKEYEEEIRNNIRFSKINQLPTMYNNSDLYNPYLSNAGMNQNNVHHYNNPYMMFQEKSQTQLYKDISSLPDSLPELSSLDSTRKNTIPPGGNIFSSLFSRSIDPGQNFK